MSQSSCECACPEVTMLPVRGFSLAVDTAALPSGIEPGPDGTHLVSRDGKLIWEPMSTPTPAGPPLLSLTWELCTAPLPGKLNLSLDNGLLSRADWAAAWAEIQATRSDLILDDAAWQAQVAEQESCAFFSSGDGATTFRVPLLRRVFPRACDPENGLKTGVWQGDAIRNITGGFGGYLQNSTWPSVTGPFGKGAAHASAPRVDYVTPSTVGATFDVSRVVPTAEENRPVSVVLTPYMQILA